MSGSGLSAQSRPSRRHGFLPHRNPKLKGWLRVAGATDTGTLTIPDLLNSNPAVQATAARKPTLNTSANGLPILDFVDDVLAWPLAAYNNGAVRFGIGFHVKLANTTGGKSLANVLSGAGMASANKWLFQATGAALRTDAYPEDRHAQGGTLVAGTWAFAYCGVDCSKGAEATQVLVAIDAAFQSLSFSNGTPWPSSMPTPTGNMLIGASSAGGGGPLVGSIGPHIYMWDDQLTATELAQYAAYERPT